MTEGVNAASTNSQYAGLGKRMQAFFFDDLIILAYIVALASVNYGIILAGGALDRVSPFFDSPVVKDGIAFLTLVLPTALYFALQESSSHRATWGKRKVGLCVVNAGGARLTRTQALARNALKLLPWQIAHTSIYHIEGWPFAPQPPSPLVTAGLVLVYVLVGSYLLSALVSKRRRTLYDWAAGSFVIVVKGGSVGEK